MQPSMKKQFSFLLFVFGFCYFGQAQSLHIPASSPVQYVKQDFGLSTIEISYSRPGVKSRKIFGDLVPYGKVWRTGANSATTIQFGDDVTIGGARVAAGKYGLLSIPGPEEWTFILTKQLDVTNPANYKEDQDVVRVKVRAQSFPYPIENFSIILSNITNASCDLALIWDRTLVALPIKTDVDTRIMAQIDSAIQGANPPYFAAAVYYTDNKKDLYKAADWFKKAAEKDPDSYPLFYQKARCEAKLGRKADAIASATRGIQLAKQANNQDFVALNEKLIATLR